MTADSKLSPLDTKNLLCDALIIGLSYIVIASPILCRFHIKAVCSATSSVLVIYSRTQLKGKLFKD